MAQLVGAEQSRKDNTRERFLNRMASSDAAQMQMNQQQAANWSQIASGIGSALQQVGAAYSDDKKKE